MRRHWLTIRILILLRLISLIAGYNLILSENQISLPGGGAVSTGYAIIVAVHHPNIILYADEHQKPYEHILETGPNRYFIKKKLPVFLQKIILQNKKPDSAAIAVSRVFYRYRRR